MPEYLSPGVYVEETNTGNKPIEGVSTSTTGLVGVTERGPVNVPILVTSIGEYRRMFGAYLPVDRFTQMPSGRVHAYLPHSVEGFFTNGGKRAYVVRVLTEDAVRANRRMFFADSTVINPMPVVLMHSAEEGTGTTTNPPHLHVAKPLAPPELKAGDVIRIGDGSRAEYRTIVAAADDDYASFDLPLQNAHALGASAYDFDRTTADDTADYTTPGGFTVGGGAVAGSTSITLTHPTAADLAKLQTILSGGPGASQLLEINTAALEGGLPAPKTAPWTEYVLAIGATTTSAGVTVTLSTPLQRSYPPPHDPHAAVPATKVSALKIPAPGATQHLTIAANGGDSILYFDTGSFTTAGDLIVVDPGLATQEVRRVGELAQLPLAVPPYETYPVGSVVELVKMKDDDRTVTGGSANSWDLDDVSAIVPGMQLVFDTGPGIVASVKLTGPLAGTVTLLANLAPPPSSVVVQPRTLTAPAQKGSLVLSLDARIGLTGALEVQPGDVVRIGNPSNLEYAIVSSLSDPRVVAPDAGSIVLEQPLAYDHAAGEPVHRQKPVFPDTTRHPTLTLQPADESSTSLLVGDGFNYAVGEVISVITPMGDVHHHVLGGSALNVTLSAITIDKALIRSHDAGATVVKREPLFEVRALDAGDWGNRVLVTAEQEETGLLPRAEVVSGTASPSPGVPSTLRLKTVTGIEAGTILELRDATNTTQIGDFLKVKGIDRAANNLVILDAPGLSATQVGAIAAAGPNPLVVRSREFRMQVFLLQRPSPAAPTRNEDVQDRELFRNLSMDDRHSRYFERIIGATFDDGAAFDDLGQPMRISDRRSEGGSQYIRVDDLMSASSDRERVRLGPEVLYDLLPSGLTRPARYRLGEGESLAHFGDDAVNTMNDKMYTGDDDLEPAHRTGIYALKNVQEISLVACPGQTTPFVQQGLIDHCEALRYRFAVLDAQGPDRDTIDDIQAQRQQYDSKYAAFYHPWLTIPDPFPTNLATIGQLPIPPSGHVLGIYANVDDTRGVHKAPANEVVLGITGLTRYLQQPEQDVLNAYPVNIDVIRDFRSNNRAIRVWGARCITSDPDWKYVNVRRLMIFIEDSIDRGLQWVVFEPNAEELWARVRRSVSNFLTTVWRNGALEGTTKDQAFYVKCDRTTMTQDDIDNGRLICVIGIAPVKPAEFVIIRIGLWTADASS